MSKRKRILSFVLVLSMLMSIVAGTVTVSAAPFVTPVPAGSSVASPEAPLTWIFSPRQYGYPDVGFPGDVVTPVVLQFDFPSITNWGYRDPWGPDLIGDGSDAPHPPTFPSMGNWYVEVYPLVPGSGDWIAANPGVPVLAPYNRPVHAPSDLPSHNPPHMQPVVDNVRRGSIFTVPDAAAGVPAHPAIEVTSLTRNTGNGWMPITDAGVCICIPPADCVCMYYLYPVFEIQNQSTTHVDPGSFPFLGVYPGIDCDATGLAPEGAPRVLSNIDVWPIAWDLYGEHMAPGVYRAVIELTRNYVQHHFHWTWQPPQYELRHNLLGEPYWVLEDDTGFWMGPDISAIHRGWDHSSPQQQVARTTVYFAVHDGRVEVIAASTPQFGATLDYGNVDLGTFAVSDIPDEWPWTEVIVKNIGYTNPPFNAPHILHEYANLATYPNAAGLAGFPLATANLRAASARWWGDWPLHFEIDEDTIRRGPTPGTIAYQEAGGLFFPVGWGDGLPIGFPDTGIGNSDPDFPGIRDMAELYEHTVRLRPYAWLGLGQIPPFYRDFTFTSDIIIESLRLYDSFHVPVSITIRRDDVVPTVAMTGFDRTVIYGTAAHTDPIPVESRLYNHGYRNLTGVTLVIEGEAPYAFDVTPESEGLIVPLHAQGTVGPNSNWLDFVVSPTPNLPPGVYYATLVIDANEFDEPEEVTLRYEVRGLLFDPCQYDGSVNFGSAELGYAPIGYREIVLTNPSHSLALTRIHVDFVGPFSSSFVMDSTRGFPAVATQVGGIPGRHYAAIIGPGESVSVWVRPMDGMLLNSYYAYLRARFEPVPPMPSLPPFMEMGTVRLDFAVTTPTISSLLINGNGNFGTVEQGDALPAARTFTIVNDGTTALLGANISLTGPDAARFTLTTAFASGSTIPVGGNVTVTVQPNSTAVLGDFAAALTVTAFSGHRSLPLSFAVVDEADPPPPPPEYEMVYDNGNWFLYINGVRWTQAGIHYKTNYWYPTYHDLPTIYKYFGPGGSNPVPANGVFDSVGIFRAGERLTGWVAWPEAYPWDIWHYATNNGTGFATGDVVLANPDSWALENPLIGTAPRRFIFSADGHLQGVAYGIYDGHFYWYGLRANQLNALLSIPDFIGLVYLDWMPQGGSSEWIYVNAQGRVAMNESVVMPNPWPTIIDHTGNLRLFFNAQGYFTHFELA